MRRTGSPAAVSLVLVLALLATTVPAVAQLPNPDGPFDPRSGRFAMGDPARGPDTLAVSSDKAWAALNQVYSQLGISLTVVDTQMRVIGSLRGLQRRPVAGERLSRVVECGTGQYGPNADRYSVQLTVLTHVRAINDKQSVIDSRVGGNASPNGLSSTVNCASTGVLEEKVVDMLKKALGL
jgi:hypothetical protein